ncbi:hypothetical protein O3Q51_18215, partial [Cryomorphaceae bacterium 1068]|nr:hypothetical protein [Cryomorphaceae bacterium 1068]
FISIRIHSCPLVQFRGQKVSVVSERSRTEANSRLTQSLDQFPELTGSELPREMNLKATWF